MDHHSTTNDAGTFSPQEELRVGVETWEITMMYRLKILWNLKRLLLLPLGGCLPGIKDSFELITFIINQYLFIFSQHERMPNRCRSQDDTDILLGRIHRGDEDKMDMKVYVDHHSITDHAGTFSHQKVLSVGVETW